jgi:2-keto-4-pentenoate hydratase/2-oxohepta-3-ene-1,7-dioic acid hydratase in catechol pathway
MIFLKPSSAVIRPGESIVLPADSQKVEQEAEIGVVVLNRLRNVSREDAERLKLGITCVNDVTARDLQKVDGQWGRAKGFDTFCPIGPEVVEGLDWRKLEVIGRVNGKEVQRGKASDMAFDIATLIAFISRVMTLEPGDVIATGTPAGTTVLKAGDITEVEIPGVGVLSNPVA